MKKINGREGQEAYERLPTTTPGNSRHHGVHVFFILQNLKNIDKSIKAAIGNYTKLKIYNNYTQRQPNRKKDNNNKNDQ